MFLRPRDIDFSKEQMIGFLLPNLQEMKEGNWPTQPSTGYEGRSPNRNNHAPFETACQIAAEVEARLNMIGKMKGIVYSLAVYFEEPSDVARKWHMSEEFMSTEYWRMINFISGWKRRHCRYPEWKLVNKILRLLK